MNLATIEIAKVLTTLVLFNINEMSSGYVYKFPYILFESLMPDFLKGLMKIQKFC